MKSVEGLTAFSKTNRVNFLVEQSKIPDEAFWDVKNRKSNLVLEVVLFLDFLDPLGLLLARCLPSHRADRRYTVTK